MANLVDAKVFSDPWVNQLSYPGFTVWIGCLVSDLRRRIPGLIPNVDPVIMAKSVRRPLADVEGAFEELGRPDDGRVHFCFDPEHRMIRLPAAPKYNKADNPNILFSWYKEWCDMGDSALKWDHLESLLAGVNERAEKTMECWDATFGRVLSEYRRGRKLLTYAELQVQVHRHGGTVTYGTVPANGSRQPLSPNGSNRSPVNRSSGSGSGSEFGSRSGSGSNGSQNRSPDHNHSSTLEYPESEQKAVPHGRKTPARQPVGVPGGHHQDPPDPESHPSTASPARRREFELAGWRLSPFGLWIPPGLD